jgi:ketosteroid isomerase-like protein
MHCGIERISKLYGEIEMGENEKAVVKRWLESVHGRAEDVWESFKANFHEDATWRLIGNTPRSGTFRGLESIKKDFLDVGRRGDGRPGPSVQGLSSDFGIRLEIDQVLSVEDGRVLVLCRSRGSGRNGVPYNNDYAWILTVRGDKIAAMEEYCDTVCIEEAHFDKKLVPRGTTTPVYEK